MIRSWSVDIADLPMLVDVALGTTLKVSRRLRCNEFLRKFSVKYTDSFQREPSEVTWLLAEIGMVLGKLEDLIDRLSTTGFLHSASQLESTIRG